MPAQRRRAPRGRPRYSAPRVLPDDLYAYNDHPAPRISPQRGSPPDAFDVERLPVIDDWPDKVPIGGQFDTLAGRNRIVPDHQMAADLRGVVGDYNSLVPETARAPIVNGVAGDIVRAAQRGHIAGDAYQSLRSRLDRAARSAAKDPELADALRGMRATLDDAMERSIVASNPNDAGAWREARSQYRNMLTIERAATGAGEDAALGLISPSQLRNATVTGQGRRAYARGRGDFAELARSGEAVMKPLPNSGTAARTAARNLGTGVPAAVGSYLGSGAGATGAVAGAVAGAAMPMLFGRAMMTGPAQRYLANQVLAAPLSPERQALVDALLTYGSSSAAGRLAAP